MKSFEFAPGFLELGQRGIVRGGAIYGDLTRDSFCPYQTCGKEAKRDLGLFELLEGRRRTGTSLPGFETCQGLAPPWQGHRVRRSRPKAQSFFLLGHAHGTGLLKK